VTTGDTERKRKPAAKKASSQRAAKKASSQPAAKKSSSQPAAKKTSSQPALPPVKVASKAAEQLVELLGREPEGVTGLEKTDDGWAVQVEVVELRRVPATTDVLGLYEVRTDPRGELIGYRRMRRYSRGASDDE
jgi:hypothetical protein